MRLIGTATSNLKRPLKERLFSKQIPYPIFEESGNEVLCLNGERSFCHKFDPCDLEQMTKTELVCFYNEIRQVLIGLDESSWIKLYRWNKDQILISSNNNDFEFPEVVKQDLDSPSQVFFGDIDPFSDINFFESYLTVNTEYWRLVSLQDLLPLSYESFLDDFGCDYVVTFKKIGEHRAKQELAQKRRTQAVTLNASHQNHEGEQAYDEANRLLRDVVTEGEGLFRVGVWFVVKAPTLDALNEDTVNLVKALHRKGARAFVETTGLDYFFNNLLIGVRPSFIKCNKRSSDYLSNLLPLNKDFLHSTGMKLYSQSGHEILLDLYHSLASNQNWLVTGSSGEGKSFLACSLMYHLVTQSNAKIGVFDLGGSLKRVAMYLGGVDLTKKFNPLQFKCPYFLKRFIVSTLGKGELTRQEEGHLFTLIESGLEKKIDSFGDLIAHISQEMKGIEYYFSELWSYFTDEIIEAPDIFYLDTEGMPEQLIAPYLVFAKELNERQIGRVVNFYDECWDVFDKCPAIVRTNAKTGRKHLIGNIFLTQEIVELSQDHGDVAKAVVGNTYGKLYFHQPDLDHPILSEFVKDKARRVKSLKGEYSEFVFSSPDNTKISRLYVSPLLYELCNSEKEHIKRQNEFISRYEGILSFKEAMNKWVKVIYE